MRISPQLFFLLLLVTVAPAAKAASSQSSLRQQLARCAALDDSQQRLACFDRLARNATSNTGESQWPVRIQPPASFLDSRLVAVPWKTEYHLTVRNFVKLISHAVMDSGKTVTVQGWSRDKHDYVLNITMRTPVKLHFLPRGSSSEKTPMSLLRPVTMDGQSIDAEQFILIIAAMGPEENTAEGKSQGTPAVSK